MDRTFLAIAAVAGALAVAAGAFGSHALAGRLPVERLSTFETGARYLMFHALALVAVALALGRWPSAAGWLQASGWCFVAGMLLFSGSLFLLTLTGIRWLGAITPLGGVAFLLGWGCLLVAAVRSA
jgi:uncharacterized membrane protein YgdD (TMEM256/DUF423 family)